MGAVVEIEGLRKEYRRRGSSTVAVDSLDLSVAPGGVFGLLGPNGSGTTTTMRCLLGLVRPTAGRMRVLGAPVPDGLAGVIRDVGAVIETPALFPTMTGVENLRLLAAIHGIPNRVVDDVLGQVGLHDRAGDLVKRYSLGMRQRLGIGAALLRDPALLVLDEPANGLDPAGIREVRLLLRRLGDEGRTVIVSSHILSEIQQSCDTMAILHHGRCVASGAVADVLRSEHDHLRVAVDDVDAGARALRDAGFAVQRDGRYLDVSTSGDDAARITRTLAAADVWVTEMRIEERTLEALFFELTEEVAA
jgi:ABC-2 type transport system ATP-binding protein